MNQKIIKYFFFIFLNLFVILFTYIIFKSFNFQSISTSVLLYSIGKLAGLIGLLFLATLIISGDTARFFDKFLGIDRIIKFQRKFALVTTIFIFFHPLFFILSDKSFSTYLIPYFASIPLALGTIALYFYIIVLISSILYKKISYNVWQYIHIGTYVLFFFSLYHAFKIGSDVGNGFIKSIFYILVFGVIVGMIYRVSYKVKQRKNKFVVKEVKWETKDTFTLVLKTDNKFKFKAGQFCFLRLNKNKLYARHPFTISSSPQEQDLHFTIKLQGRFTKIASKLKEGEEVIVEGPFGTFTIEKNTKNLVFVAGGVGITPFMSIIRDHLIKNKDQIINLIYCSRKKSEKIFINELDKINENWFKKLYILSEDENYSDEDEKGFISKEIIIKYVKNLDNSLFYVCGPEVMKKSVEKILIDIGIKKKNIIVEDFFW